MHTLLLNWTALVICTREGRLESSGHVILIFYIGRLVIVGGREEEVVLQLFLLTCQTVVVVLFSSYFFFPEKAKERIIKKNFIFPYFHLIIKLS